MRIRSNECELKKKREEQYNLMRAIAHLHQDPDPKDVADQVGKVLDQGFTPRYTAFVP